MNFKAAFFISVVLLVCFLNAFPGSFSNGSEESTDSDKSGLPATQDHLVVKTAKGQVKGFQKTLSTSDIVDIFLGIPYAKPPTGQLRFKAPAASDPWTGIKDATSRANQCLQPSPNGNQVFPEGEDCLSLNVYKPHHTNSSVTSLVPVMVWIHGGGFVAGSGSYFDGSILASNGIVVITINYRLGVFGFMSTEDGTMPGNYAMMDQLMALKWVRENAQAFGGDPNLVTVFGQSAGSASISLLLLSPLAKGLFKRAIMESGSSLSPFSVVGPWEEISPKTIAKLVSERVGCNQAATVELLTCLQGLGAYEILNATKGVTKVFPMAMFKPRVEKTYGFLPDHPFKLLSTDHFSHVDTLRGYTSHELAGLPQDPENDGITVQEFHKGVNRTLKDNFSFLNPDLVTGNITKRYLSNVSDAMKIRSLAGQFLTDLYFVAPAIKELQLSLKSNSMSKSFLYQFDYRASFAQTPPWVGAVHASEVPFVFGLPIDMVSPISPNATLVTTDKDVASGMVKMWTNFVKYGNPDHQNVASGWKPFDTKFPQFLRICAQPQLESFSDNELLGLFDIILKEGEKALLEDSSVVG